jgi:hypothetical protein
MGFPEGSNMKVPKGFGYIFWSFFFRRQFLKAIFPLTAHEVKGIFWVVVAVCTPIHSTTNPLTFWRM